MKIRVFVCMYVCIYLLPVQFKKANEPLTMSATSPVASRATVAPAITTIIKYVTVVIKMANKVPFGMDFCGSFLHKVMKTVKKETNKKKKNTTIKINIS